MNFSEAVSVCFKKYATVQGRATRSEYWYWTLFTVLASIVLSILDVAIFDISIDDPSALSPLDTIFSFATILPSIAVSGRRLHDINFRAWWILISLTIIGIIPLLIMYCLQGTAGGNRFGPDPLATQTVPRA